MSHAHALDSATGLWGAVSVMRPSHGTEDEAMVSKHLESYVDRAFSESVSSDFSISDTNLCVAEYGR